MRFNYLLFLLPLYLLALPGFFEPWGKDADLNYNPYPSTEPHYSLPAIVIKKIVHFHQQVLSPIDGPRSHFIPTSSSYMWEAVAKYGFIKGYIMGCDRLLRENDDPWIYQTTLIDGEIWKVDEP